MLEMFTFFPTAENVGVGLVACMAFVGIPGALLFGAYQGATWIKYNYFDSREEAKRSLTITGKVIGAVLAAYIVVGNIGRISGIQINPAQAVEQK